MRNSLTVLACLLTALPASAQIILDPAEVTAATAECAQHVSIDCLSTLALHALATQATVPQDTRAISYIAEAQARAGDIAGATRTLTFGSPTPEALMAMGQWDAAYALAEESFDTTIVEIGTAEGSFKIQMVLRQLEQNQLALAVHTAASITDQGEHDDALQTIIDTLPPAAAFALATQMNSDGGMFEQGRARDRALLGISQTQIAQGDLFGAASTIQTIADPNTQCEALTALAAAQPADVAGQTLAAAALIVDQRRDPLSDGLQPVTCLLSISTIHFESGNMAQAAATARAAVTYMDNLQAQFGPSALFAAQTRAATALALAGDPAGTHLLDLPMSPDLRADERRRLATLRYIAFTRLGDQRAAAELTNYLALVNTKPTDRGALKDAALELVQRGFLTQALDLTPIITSIPYSEYEAYDVYLAIAKADAEMALAALPDIEIDYMHTAVAASIARTFHANGDSQRARVLLADTVTWAMAASPDDRNPFGDWKVGLLAELATAQTDLGFPEDAQATLQTAFVETQKIEPTHFRVDALLRIAAALRS